MSYSHLKMFVVFFGLFGLYIVQDVIFKVIIFIAVLNELIRLERDNL